MRSINSYLLLLYNISEKPKEVFIMNKQLSDNQLTEEYIREFQDKVDWKSISWRQKLSEEFIREFKDKVNWRVISRRQTLSDEFIKEFHDLLM